MANVSTSRKLGIAARVAGQQVRRSRTYSAVLSAAKATAGHFLSIMRQLWLEVTGFVFVIFAGLGLVFSGNWGIYCRFRALQNELIPNQLNIRQKPAAAARWPEFPRPE